MESPDANVRVRRRQPEIPGRQLCHWAKSLTQPESSKGSNFTRGCWRRPCYLGRTNSFELMQRIHPLILISSSHSLDFLFKEYRSEWLHPPLQEFNDTGQHLKLNKNCGLKGGDVIDRQHIQRVNYKWSAQRKTPKGKSELNEEAKARLLCPKCPLSFQGVEPRSLETSRSGKHEPTVPWGCYPSSIWGSVPMLFFGGLQKSWRPGHKITDSQMWKVASKI